MRSTNSVAFAIIEDGKLAKHGKIDIRGNDIYEKIHDARKKDLCHEKASKV